MVSKCPKCDGTTFEWKEHTPTGSRFKVGFVQCAKCGVVVGVIEYMNTFTTLQNISQQLEQILKKLDKM